MGEAQSEETYDEVALVGKQIGVCGWWDQGLMGCPGPRGDAHVVETVTWAEIFQKIRITGDGDRRRRKLI